MFGWMPLCSMPMAERWSHHAVKRVEVGNPEGDVVERTWCVGLTATEQNHPEGRSVDAAA